MCFALVGSLDRIGLISFPGDLGLGGPIFFTAFSPTLYHRFGRSYASRPTYKARGPLPPKSPDWWERDALLYKVVMAPSPRQGGTKLEWPTPHKAEPGSDTRSDAPQQAAACLRASGRI
jgi:hypothetical protein